MKRISTVSAALALAALAASAQDAPLARQIKVIGIGGAVMGKTVKGAPYSGTEIAESTQTLGDGTRIHNWTQTQVFRDSEGRVRRESGDTVTIYDPVGNATYMLNTKTQTARKLPLGTYLFQSNDGGSKINIQYFRFQTSGAGGAPPPLPPPSPDEQLDNLRRSVAKLKAMQDTVQAESIAVSDLKRGPAGSLQTESLGKRQMEGVNTEGTRDTETIPTGAIGNDRPIQSVTERWYSPDLQTFIQTRHTDPRVGEETFHLTNIVRSEPPAYLFQVPAGYQIH